MKLSLKLQDQQLRQDQPNQTQNHRQPPLLLRAKIPIAIFNLPFLSHFSTTTVHPSDLSLALSTNFASGPSLKLSYSTNSSAGATAAASIPANPSLTLTLKSGTGVFGSPRNSPLVISAHFSIDPLNPSNPNPTFSLLFKPQLGSFSLRKTTFSHSKPNLGNKPNGGAANFDSNSFGFVPLERPVGVKDFSLAKDDKDSILKGISVMAQTGMPVTKRVALNFRWGVNFPDDLEKQMPFLRVNKIGIERIDEVVKEENKKKSEGNGGELDVLKGMCFWMKKELDVLQRENREMKIKLEETKAGHSVRKGSSSGTYKEKAMPPIESSMDRFEQWRSNKNNGGEENGMANVKKEVKKNGNRASDVESELQRAIKAASSS